VIYPWTAADRQAGTTVIRDPDELPTTLSNLKKYMPKIWLRLKGGTLYPKIMVGMENNPDMVVEDISWWLKSTTQGMWPAQLQDAEDTTCLGWLLFSTDEMDKEALHKEIWQMMGVQVAIHFQAIDDGVYKKSSNSGQKLEQATKPKMTISPVKALHLEINWLEPYNM